MHSDYQEKTPSEKRDFWENQIRFWRESGLSQSEYCKQNGIRQSQWFYWRRRCRNTEAGFTLVPLKLQSLNGHSHRGPMVRVAQMAASETMMQIIGSRTQSLFGTTSNDVKGAFSKLATNKQFSLFARDFFARLINKCLDYFVSKAVSHNVGEGKRFRTLAQHGEFTKALGTHSREAAKIIEEFSGGWFSKTNWEKKGISRKDAAGFTHVAIKKIVAELKEGAQTDG